MNLANCANPDSVFNTGIPLCDLAKGKIKGIILMDRGVVATPSDRASTAAFLAWLRTGTTAARGSRIYPILDLNNFEDNTGDPSTGGIGNLTTATIIVSDAIPAFRFGYNGSEARHKRMSLMNGASLDVMFIDDKFAVYGTQKGDDLGGYSVLQAYADTSKFIVADAVNQYGFRLTLGSITEYRDSSAYVVTNSSIMTLQGLIDVQMTYLSNVAEAIKYQPIADGGTNLEPANGGAIDGLTHTAVNLETGNAITVDSVADSPSDDSILVTLDDLAWAALASGDRVQIYGPSAAALAGVGVKPYEFIPFIVTK